MFSIVITCIVISLILIVIFGPDDPNTVEPCPTCGGQMKHLPGEESNSTAEARFGCIDCDYSEFRGGWCSELPYERKHKL